MRYLKNITDVKNTVITTNLSGRISMIIYDLNNLETVSAENVVGGCGRKYKYDTKPKYQPTKYDKKPNYYEPTKSYDPCDTVCYQKCDEKDNKKEPTKVYITKCEPYNYYS